MAETIGTAYLSIAVDTTNMQAGLSTAKRSVSDMSAAAQAEYNKLTAAQKRVADSALSYAQTIGKAREEVRALNVEQRIGGQLGKEIAATIRAQAAAQQTLNTAMGGTAVSARQTAAALRGVPAQLTDIFVSLQGGQNPMTVLFQQGGQLRDMFGSTGAAARALGSSIMGLVNPYTVAAAAVATLGMAWRSAAQEAENFARASIQSGGSVNVDELERMADALDRTTTATQGKAASVLAQVTATGRFTAEEIQRVAKAAVEMEDAFGQSIDKTIQDFVKLKEAPSEYILKLNETGVVTRFLTEETLEAVRALEEQEKHTDAARVASAALADTIGTRSAEVTQNLSTWSSIFRDIGKAAGEAADEVKDYFRDIDVESRSAIDSIAAMLQSINPTLGTLTRGFGAYYGAKAAQTKRQASQPVPGVGTPLPDPAELARREKERKEAEQSWASLVQSNLSKEERQRREIAKIREDGAKLGKSEAEIQRQIAASQARYAESLRKPPKPKKTDAQREAEQAARTAQSLLERIQQQVKLNEEAARSTDELTASERLAVTAKLELDKVSGKVQASQRQEIEAALEQLRVSGELVEAQKAQKELAEDLARARTESAMALLNQTRANAAEIAGLVLGRQALDQATRRLEIEREFEDKVAALRRDGLAETSESYREQVAIYARTRDEMLAKEEEHQRRLAEVRADWRNGARSALEDYATAAADVAGQTYDVFSGAMSGLEDALVEFAKTGKLAFSDLVDSIIADITRMFARQAVQQLFGAMFGGAGQGSGFMAWATGNPLSGGWSSGGYTGPGGKYEPAGIVHRGEVVWSQDDIRRAGGVAVVEALRRGTAPGYASGGVVGMRAPPRSTKAAEPQKVTVLVENYSSTPARAEESTDAEGGKLIKVIVDAAVSEVDRRIGAMGSTGRTIQGRFGLAPMGGSRG